MSVLFLKREFEVSKIFTHQRSGFLDEPATRDTHERDDNVIFAQFGNLGDTSVCHRECIVIAMKLLTKARKESPYSRSCACNGYDEYLREGEKSSLYS
jgi:hypothetical protein